MISIFIFNDSMWDMVMEWRFMPWLSTIPSISTKQTITSNLKITEHNKDNYTQVVKNVNNLYKWFKMSIVYTSG